VQVCLVVAWRRVAMQGRQILAQNLIYFMSFVDFYHMQGVALPVPGLAPINNNAGGTQENV